MSTIICEVFFFVIFNCMLHYQGESPQPISIILLGLNCRTKLNKYSASPEQKLVFGNEYVNWCEGRLEISIISSLNLKLSNIDNCSEVLKLMALSSLSVLKECLSLSD